MARISAKAHVLAIAADDQTAPDLSADALLHLRNIDIDGQSPEVDVTSSGDDWGQFVSGASPGATMTATFVTDVAGATPFQAWDAWADGDARNMAWAPEGLGTGLTSFEFLGIVLQHQTSAAYDGTIEGTIQVRINSLPTFAAQS